MIFRICRARYLRLWRTPADWCNHVIGWFWGEAPENAHWLSYAFLLPNIVFSPQTNLSNIFIKSWTNSFRKTKQTCAIKFYSAFYKTKCIHSVNNHMSFRNLVKNRWRYLLCLLLSLRLHFAKKMSKLFIAYCHLHIQFFSWDNVSCRC